MNTLIISRSSDDADEWMDCDCSWRNEARNSVTSLVRSIEHIQQVHEEGIIKISYLTNPDFIIVTSNGIHIQGSK